MIPVEERKRSKNFILIRSIFTPVLIINERTSCFSPLINANERPCEQPVSKTR